MRRVMLVPAAGRGTRLGSAIPKLLVPVNGRPMIEYILDRYAALMERFVIVVAPTFAAAVEDSLSRRREPIEYAVQPSATGMLDAILVPGERLATLAPDEIWITWCDQVAVRPDTVERLKEAMQQTPLPALAFPTFTQPQPYIHYARDREGRITAVLQRREGAVMPEVGEGDIGLFAMRRTTYQDLLPVFATRAEAGSLTKERNFLPFIPWLASSHPVVTVPAHDPLEAIGINTPDDLLYVSSLMRHRA